MRHTHVITVRLDGWEDARMCSPTVEEQVDLESYARACAAVRWPGTVGKPVEVSIRAMGAPAR